MIGHYDLLFVLLQHLISVILTIHEGPQHAEGSLRLLTTTCTKHLAGYSKHPHKITTIISHVLMNQNDNKRCL